jgi:hypothetical protein
MSPVSASSAVARMSACRSVSRSVGALDLQTEQADPERLAVGLGVGARPRTRTEASRVRARSAVAGSSPATKVSRSGAATPRRPPRQASASASPASSRIGSRLVLPAARPRGAGVEQQERQRLALQRAEARLRLVRALPVAGSGGPDRPRTARELVAQDALVDPGQRESCGT